MRCVTCRREASLNACELCADCAKAVPMLLGHKRAPSALAPRRKPKVTRAELAEAFERNKEGL